MCSIDLVSPHTGSELLFVQAVAQPSKTTFANLCPSKLVTTSSSLHKQVFCRSLHLPLYFFVSMKDLGSYKQWSSTMLWHCPTWRKILQSLVDVRHFCYSAVFHGLSSCSLCVYFIPLQFVIKQVLLWAFVMKHSTLPKAHKHQLNSSNVMPRPDISYGNPLEGTCSWSLTHFFSYSTHFLVVPLKKHMDVSIILKLYSLFAVLMRAGVCFLAR